MAYSVDWIAKVITVPVTDLTLVSGVNYTFDTEAFWREVRRLEWEFSEGLWAPQAIDYVDSQLLSGLVYSPIVKLINGYTWQTDGSNINISLIGYNSNLLDFFNPGSGVSVLANNSAGKTSDTVEAKVDAIKAKTDDITFTKANEVDVNVQSMNDATLLGDGTNGDKWRG